MDPSPNPDVNGPMVITETTVDAAPPPPVETVTQTVTPQVQESSDAAQAVSDAEGEELKSFAGELQAAVDAYVAGSRDGIGGLGGRKRIMTAADKILGTLKDPGSQWMERSVQIGNMGAEHLFQVWGGFEQIPSEGSITFSDLAKKLEAETSVVERILGVLLASGMLKLVGTDSVAHTARSRVFLDGNPVGVIYRLAWDNGMVPYFHLPEYFEKYGRKEPQEQSHIPATFARGHAEKTFWEVLAMDPAYLQRFFKGMAVIEGQAPAAGIYDFGWLVDKAREEPGDRAVFVDVGGGKGHALLAIQNEFPGLPLERFVLQDRAESIAAVEAAGDPGLVPVQKVAIDFHKEQPTKGAMVYFIRRCLHNYSDTIVINMLRVLAGAMADDSHLLIQEDVKTMPPDQDNAVLDFLMMTYGGKERSRECWEQVLSQAGLKLAGISHGSGPWAALSVIDCMKG